MRRLGPPARRPAGDRPVGGAASRLAVPTFAAHSGAEGSSGPGVLAVCKSLFAGGVAGGVSRTAVAPLERLKILQQVAGSSTAVYNGVWGGLGHIWKTEGVRGMFKGNGANCIRIVPNSASKFLAYEYLEGAIIARAQSRTRTRSSGRSRASAPAPAPGFSP